MNPLFEHEYVLTMQNIFLLGLVTATVILIWLKRNKSPYFLTSLPLFVITFHQVEEYIIAPAFLGDAYHFLNWAYRSGLEILPVEVVAINLGAYVAALIPFLFKPSTKLFSLVFLFVNSGALANAALHVGAATLQTEFSPGMVTSLVLFLPLFIKSISIASEKSVSFEIVSVISVLGFLTHFGLIARVNIF